MNEEECIEKVLGGIRWASREPDKVKEIEESVEITLNLLKSILRLECYREMVKHYRAKEVQNVTC